MDAPGRTGEHGAAGGGSIINTASIAADHGQTGSFVYGATKGAILSMTRIAATE